MQWHPDRHSTNSAKLAEAETRIKEINAAFTYLKRIKSISSRRNRSKTRSYKSRQKSYQSQSNGYSSNSSGSRSQTKKRTYSSGSKSRSNGKSSTHSKRKSTSQKTQQRQSRKTEVELTWFDRLMTRATNWRLARNMEYSRDRNIRSSSNQIHKERKRWKDAKKKFHNNTRIGVYSSLFNAMVFGKLERKQSSENGQTTSLGGYNANDKYDIIVRHSIIRDHIFYSFNRGLNLFFKYSLCIILVVQILFLIYQNFRWGTFWGDTWEFVGNQTMVLGMLAVLFLPDNLYQRYLLWHFRNLSLKKVRKLFKDKRLPQPYEYYKNWMLVGKYSLLSGLIWFFF
jgi:hypothetical protein